MKKIVSLTFLFFNFLIYAQDFDFSSLSIPESLKEDANSVVRFENVSIEIKSQSEMSISIEKAITIFNKLGDSYADISLNYDKRRIIKNIEAYIYDETGNEIKKIKKKDFKDYSLYDGFSLYIDGRILHYDHTPITYPYTIYYKYEIKTSNTAFIPSWNLNDGYYQSIQNAVFIVKYPSEITLFKSEKNFKGFEIKKNEESGLLSYKIKDILALKNEPYAPALYNFLPNVKFGISKFNLEGVDGEASNWKEFGKWYYDNLIKQTLELSEATKHKIQKLTSEVSEPIEKAKIVYEYVQNKVRYISVQVGIGGFKPMLAGDVDNLGYGDCKALTNYTASLLKAVGIPSFHTLIYAAEKRNLDPDVASPQGNHMILYVPISNQDIWLECTSQKNPFAEIGDFTNDRDALVITPEGGILKHTRIYKTEENLQLTKGNYTIDSIGAINANITIESSGTQYGDDLLKYDGKSPKDLDVLFKKYLSNINNIKFSKIDLKNNRKENKYEESLKFTASDYASFSGNQMIIPINAFNKNLSVPNRIRDRKLPFEISNGFLDIDEVEIKLPTISKIEYMPENFELNSKFGKYSMELIKIDEHMYLYKRTLQIEEGNYLKEEYEAYVNFRKSIGKQDNSKIILTK